MGSQASKPADPNTTKVRVIGVGFWRTGTASLAEALAILLQEPTYHGGTQMMHGSVSHVSRWMDIMRLGNSRDSRIESGALLPGSTAEIAETLHIKAQIAHQLRGYAATTDSPMTYLLKEMVEIYPDAIFIVNTRDPAPWWDSVAVLKDAAQDNALRWQLWPIMRGVRYWPAYADEVGERLGHLGMSINPDLYNDYMELVRRVVPEDKLRYYDVKDGWGPLCDILGADVPKDVPFPHINDSRAVRQFHARQKRNGLIAWTGILGAALGAGVLGWRYLPKSVLRAAWKTTGL